jgi:acetyltransferase-like isoleucine patch superfamily enzyme
MYMKFKNKIIKSGKLDFGGIIFFSIDLFRKNIHVLLFNRIIHVLCYMKGIKLGKHVVFNGKPIINRYPHSTIIFGDNCKFNSTLYSMSIGLHQPCAFATYDENSRIEIGNNCGASGLKIHAKSKISIGNNVLIGMGSTILDNDAHNSVAAKRELNIIPSRPVTVEDNVFIGLNCTILKGVTIGKNSVIAAGSVVFNSIPENSIAAGNPCKVIIRRG